MVDKELLELLLEDDEVHLLLAQNECLPQEYYHRLYEHTFNIEFKKGSYSRFELLSKLVRNKKVSSELLAKITKDCDDDTIRTYVVRNKNTSIETLLFITDVGGMENNVREARRELQRRAGK